ncbi:MAG: hypothetical protein ABSB33_00990 [Tepidisphaeraceae bacterium]
MNELAYKIGLRLARVGFVRSAIDDRADLSAFKGRPTFRVLLGVFLIGFSFLMCWPVFFVLTGISIRMRMPGLMIAWPFVYFSSHLCFLAGMAISGADYSRLFLRWAARVGVEKLLSFGASEQEPEA